MKGEFSTTEGQLSQQLPSLDWSIFSVWVLYLTVQVFFARVSIKTWKHVGTSLRPWPKLPLLIIYSLAINENNKQLKLSPRVPYVSNSYIWSGGKKRLYLQRLNHFTLKLKLSSFEITWFLYKRVVGKLARLFHLPCVLFSFPLFPSSSLPDWLFTTLWLCSC